MKIGRFRGNFPELSFVRAMCRGSRAFRTSAGAGVSRHKLFFSKQQSSIIMIRQSTRTFLGTISCRRTSLTVGHIPAKASLSAGPNPRLTNLASHKRHDKTLASSWVKPLSGRALDDEVKLADHSWRQANHIWTPEEIDNRIASKDMKHTVRFTTLIRASEISKLFDR